MGGRADLAAGRVRFVGDPRRRIAEDYLRILRFFRFHARLGRGEPDPAALAACAELAAGIDGLSGERVRQELWLILGGAEPLRALAPMVDAGVLARVVPGPLALPALAALVAQGAPVDPVLRLAALLRPAEAGRVEAVAGRLRLANRERERLLALVTTPLPMGDAPAQRRALHRLGADLYGDLLRLGEAAGKLERGGDRTARACRGLAAPAFPLAGADLLALGVAEGPAVVGSWLRGERGVGGIGLRARPRAACLALLLARPARDLTP